MKKYKFVNPFKSAVAIDGIAKTVLIIAVMALSPILACVAFYGNMVLCGILSLSIFVVAAGVFLYENALEFSAEYKQQLIDQLEAQ